jgi:hypothetical protein
VKILFFTYVLPVHWVRIGLHPPADPVACMARVSRYVGTVRSAGSLRTPLVRVASTSVPTSYVRTDLSTTGLLRVWSLNRRYWRSSTLGPY